jgi:hypothetical protein
MIRKSLIILFILLSGPVHADWQKTRWDMSPAEVSSLYPTLKPVPRNPNATISSQVLLRGPYSDGPFQFTIEFAFDSSNKLSAVGFTLEQYSSCTQLFDQIRNSHGEPSSKQKIEDGLYYYWDDSVHHNEVNLIDSSIHAICMFSYEKIK